MTSLITAEEVTLNNLTSHIEAAGLSPVPVDDKQFRLRTPSGIAFWIAIEEDRQFLRFHTYLPTTRAKDRQAKLEFAHQLSTDIFLPTFCLDVDGDVLVNYVLPFQYGLIAEQFVALVRRFSSLLNYLVQKYDTIGMFDFGLSTVITVDSNSEDQSQPLMLRPDGTLLN